MTDVLARNFRPSVTYGVQVSYFMIQLPSMLILEETFSILFENQVEILRKVENQSIVGVERIIGDGPQFAAEGVIRRSKHP